MGNILHTLYNQAEDIMEKQNKTIIEKTKDAQIIAKRKLNNVKSTIPGAKSINVNKKESQRQKNFEEIFDFYSK